ncbi:MAG: Vps62-related protein [Oligoflexales bacterium]|nr:Vps62-related protein [Oligoflexales bacterium]
MEPADYYPVIRDSKDDLFYMAVRDSFMQGKIPSVIANIVSGGREIHYWFFYPKNGCQGMKIEYYKNIIQIGEAGQRTRSFELCNFAVHEGDWERVAVILDENMEEIKKVFYSSHGGGILIPRQAAELSGEHPVVHVALNSHANFPKGIGFSPNVTFQNKYIDALSGIKWLQIGDIVTDRASLHKDPSGGRNDVTVWETGKNLKMWQQIQNEPFAGYRGSWGIPANALKITDPPHLPGVLIEKIVKIGSKLVLENSSGLSKKSVGSPPGSPWNRGPAWSESIEISEPESTGFIHSDLFGGAHGNAFDDMLVLVPDKPVKVTSITIRTGRRLDSICTDYRDQKSICHGQNGGTPKTITLSDDEYIAKVEVSTGRHDPGIFAGKRTRIFAIKITTSKSQVVEGGSFTGTAKEFIAPKGMHIAGFHGRSGEEIDQLGVIFASLPEHELWSQRQTPLFLWRQRIAALEISLPASITAKAAPIGNRSPG